MATRKVIIPIDEYNGLIEASKNGATFWNTEFKCPNCKHVNKWLQHKFPLGTEHQFVYCNSEDGGCDKKFVLKSKVTTEIQVTSIKIEE